MSFQGLHPGETAEEVPPALGQAASVGCYQLAGAPQAGGDSVAVWVGISTVGGDEAGDEASGVSGLAVLRTQPVMTIMGWVLSPVIPEE